MWTPTRDGATDEEAVNLLDDGLLSRGRGGYRLKRFACRYIEVNHTAPGPLCCGYGLVTEAPQGPQGRLAGVRQRDVEGCSHVSAVEISLINCLRSTTVLEFRRPVGGDYQQR